MDLNFNFIINHQKVDNLVRKWVYLKNINAKYISSFQKVYNILKSKPNLDILSKYDDFVQSSDLQSSETLWPQPTIQNVL